MAVGFPRDKVCVVPTVDLNADLGEGCGADEEVLALVSSASIACGAHAGDDQTMRATIEAALEQGVSIGAHPGYADREGFGRIETGATPAAIRELILGQLDTFAGACAAAGAAFSHVKPHGALYNAIVHHEEQAAAVVEAVVAFDPTLPVLGLPGSVWLRLAAEAGLRTVPEAFADRAYTPEGTLVSRQLPGAVLHDPDEIARRCVAMAAGEPVTDVDGGALTLRPGSICVHGDTTGAVAIARAVRTALTESGVELAPFS